MLQVVTVIIVTVWHFLANCTRNNVVLVPLFMEYNNENYWFQLYMASITLIILPLLPIMCPMLWILLNLIGETKTLTHCVNSQLNEHNDSVGFVYGFRKVVSC